MDVSQHILVNDTIKNKVDIHFPFYDYGFLYGYGVFETIRVCNFNPLLLDLHLKRLIYGAQILDISFHDSVDVLTERLHRLITLNQCRDGVLNIYLTPGNKMDRSFAFSSPFFLAVLRPLPDIDPMKGIDVALREESCKRTKLDQIKSLSYMKNILEKRFAEPFDDVILTDDKQQILETPMANVFFVKDGQLITPKSEFILPGTVREYIISQQDTLNISVIEDVVTVDDLSEMDEVFITNSMWGICFVDSVEGVGALRSGEMTHKVHRCYTEQVIAA